MLISAQDMRGTLIRLGQVIQKSSLSANARVVPALGPYVPPTKQPRVIDILAKRREEEGENWPSNIRIEPLLRKEDFKGVEDKKALRKLKKIVLQEH
jgi:hypothetical protein